MPTVTKTKTHSKCRAWEQERRKRLGVAFSNLAAALPPQPSTTSSSASSTPNTKILILQHSLHYIQELQAATRNNNSKEEAVDVAVETDEVDEVRILKAKCWELVKILVQQKIPLPTPPPSTISPADKYINSTDTNKTEKDEEITKENVNIPSSTPAAPNINAIEKTSSNSACNTVEDDNIVCDDVEQDAGGSCEEGEGEGKEKRADSNKDKCTHCKRDAGKREGKGKGKSKGKRNVKKKPTINRKHTRKKGVTLGVVGGVGSAGTATANIHNINNTSNVWVTNAALRGPVVLPLLPPLLPPAPPTIFINPFPFPLLTAPRKLVHGFDITKTTMVNKVPIPTTTLSMAKKKAVGKSLKQLPKVTYQSKFKLLKAMKEEARKLKEKKSDANNKELNNKDVPKTVAEVVTSDKSDVVPTSNQANVSNNKPSTNSNKKAETAAREVSKTDSNSSPNKQEGKSDAKQNVAQESQVKVMAEVTKVSQVDGDKRKVEAIQSTAEQSGISNQSSKSEAVCSSGAKPSSSSGSVLGTSSKVAEDSSSCNRETSNKRRKVEESVAENERQEISGDMGEELSLPSPTAAFLLTFPLVCPGPSEPMQPPQDHFSNYFTRETSVSTATQTNAFLPNDLPVTKPSLVADLTKTTWTLTPNTATNSKMSNDARLFVMPERNVSSTKDVSKDVPSSSACVFSGSQNIFPSVCNNNYPFSESIFNYEHAPVGGNIKGIGKASYSQSNKVPFNFDNLHSDNKQHTSVPDSSMYSTAPHNIINNDSSSNFLYNNSDKDNKNTGAVPCGNNTKKSYDNTTNSNSCKLFLASAAATTNKSDAYPTSVQSKQVFPNTCTIYTSTNSYNPFDLPITPTTFSASNSITSNNNLRSKSSNMYFPDFAVSNIYTQSCNLWMDDNNSYGGEYIKTDFVKKPSNTMQNNASSSVVMDTQPDFRYPVSIPSKNSNIHISNNNKNTDTSQTNKNIKVVGKISVKETKYLVQDNKETKSEYATQKGPINWMTSEVNFGQNNQDIIFPNNNQKDLRNNMLQGSNQCTALDTGLPIAAGLSTGMSCNKKTDLYDQPFYMPSGGFVPQTLNDDNQFTWSPSKLMPLTEPAPLVPCSLPTLVGDLSLSMGETKQTYQHLFLEQPDNNAVHKSSEKKGNQQKNKTPVKTNNNKVECEMNASNAGSFLSVSQIMERGKEENVYQDASTLPKGTSVHYNQNRTNINKHVGDVPVFPTEVFGVQQMSDYFPPPPPLHKATQKNTYSTESLLQSTDNHYVSSNTKSKNINKSYEASNLCISSNVQHTNGNNQMEFENFSHTNFSNSYCYPGSVNTPLYTTSNYLPVTGSSVSSYSCINSGYMPDANDYSANMDNNFYTKMDPCSSLEVPKYNFDPQHKINVSSKHHKGDNSKKEAVMKRQRKSKAGGNEGYAMAVGGQRCYPGGDDGGVYGYQMPMSAYSASHKAAGSHAKAGPGSPNHSGTSSLANFNLSTIFPEINKRPVMPGYPDSSHKPSMSLYL